MVTDSVPPFAADTGWYSVWLKACMVGSPDPIGMANKEKSISGKIYTRTSLLGSSGDLLLSIPLEGGGRQLRNLRLPVKSLKLSDHGNWRHVHLGALEAIYGKTPFYPHIIESLITVYESPTESLAEFNFAIHQALTRFLCGEIELDSLQLSRQAYERGKELLKSMDKKISVIDPLMRYGRETLLGLASME